MNLEKIKLKAKKMRSEHINNAFFSACKKGQLDIVQYLFQSSDICCKPNIYYDNSQSLLYACASGNLELVKFLVSPHSINAHIEDNFNNVSLLDVACSHGHFEITRYLLTDPDLIEFKKNANIHFNNDMALRLACKSFSPNALDIVKYLLTSPDLKEHSYINIKNNKLIQYYEIDNIQYQSALTYACSSNNFAIVKYLLLSSELTEHADIHHNNDAALISSFNHLDLKLADSFNIIKFLTTCIDLKEHITANTRDDYLYFKAKHNNYNFIDIMIFLITECKLQKTETIEKDIEIYPSHLQDLALHLNYYFDKSSLYNNIDKQLSTRSNLHSNKIKL